MIIDYLHRKRLQGAVLEQQLAEAELILREYELRQMRARLTSPVGGVILRREAFSEQFLPSGTALLEIGNLDDLEIEAEILSQEAGPIRIGNDVEIYGPTLGRDVGEGLRGTVHRIHPDAFTKISSLGVEQQRVRVDIRLDEQGMKLCRSLGIGIGYRVRVRIVTESRDQVLSVPRSSVFRNDQGSWSLFVVREGRLVEQAVDVGILNDDWVEIATGVEESEAVVLAPDSNLRSGDRVRSIPAAVFRRGRVADE
jgi:HlyD family secretion protein